jgi:hypothetical protein
MNKYGNVRFEVFTAVTMTNSVFWDVTLVRIDVSEECITSNIRVLVTFKVFLPRRFLSL